jgi:hypothetical protein
VDYDSTQRLCANAVVTASVRDTQIATGRDNPICTLQTNTGQDQAAHSVWGGQVQHGDSAKIMQVLTIR